MVDDALALAEQGNEAGEVVVIGGAEIYDVFVPLAHRIELTEIHASCPGDTTMAEPGATGCRRARGSPR